MSCTNETAAQLDSDLLRTFLAVADAGSVTAGAERVLRSQSAVSLQIKRLEAILGRPVLERRGRGISLTAYGETLLPVADRVVRLLDSAVADAHAGGIRGRLCIGVPEEVGQEVLTALVSGISRAHPRVDLTVRCGISSGFPEAVARGELDAAICDVEEPAPGLPILRTVPRFWVAAAGHDLADRDPLPVALFDRACAWRDLAVDALEAAGRPYRVVYTSESVAGILAAVRSGLAVALMGEIGMTTGIERVDGLPTVSPSHLILMYRPGLDSESSVAIETAARASLRLRGVR